MSIGIVCCFFNPHQSIRMLENFKRFYSGLDRYRKLLNVVECVFGDRDSQLHGHIRNTKVVHANSIMWQKERLLNIGIYDVIDSADAVIWIDTDLLFEKSNWVHLVDKTLEKTDVLQPFSSVVEMNACGERVLRSHSFSKLVSEDQTLVHGKFHEHGHTGYCWAMRSSYLKCSGLFDACILGGADHVMAHAFSGSLDSHCLSPLLGENTSLSSLYSKWANSLLGGKKALQMGSVNQLVEHLAHGSQQGRMYLGRNRLLTQSGFCPLKDIEKNQDGCWEWKKHGLASKELANNYFLNRKEDELSA